MFAVLTGGVATLLWSLSQRQNGAAKQQLSGPAHQDGVAMKDAVVVFGSTGKLGRQIVAQVRGHWPVHACMPWQWGLVCCRCMAMHLLCIEMLLCCAAAGVWPQCGSGGA